MNTNQSTKTQSAGSHQPNLQETTPLNDVNVGDVINFMDLMIMEGIPSPQRSQMNYRDVASNPDSPLVNQGLNIKLVQADNQQIDQSLSSSSNSFGSLEDLRRELLNSIYKNMKQDNSTLTKSQTTEQTENTDYHSVFHNSGLRIRGIDVDNMQTQDGKELNIYQLFKARYQLFEQKGANIRNEDVVMAVNTWLQKPMSYSAQKFLKFDHTDYRPQGYKPTDDKNFQRFNQIWAQNKLQTLGSCQPREQTQPQPVSNQINADYARQMHGRGGFSHNLPGVSNFEE